MAVDRRPASKAVAWLVTLILLLACIAAFFAFNVDELAKYQFYKLTYKQSESASDADFDGCFPEAPGTICVSMDIRAFTLYAFLEGVAGYEAENEAFKSQERLQLELDLSTRLSAIPASRIKRWKDYYDAHPYHVYSYLYYVLSLGKPPEFKYIIPKSEIADASFYMLGGFSKVLGDFFTAVKVDELYAWHEKAGLFKVESTYDLALIAEQKKFADRYMRVNQFGNRAISLGIIPMPYESHYTAYSITYGDLTYIVDGPGSSEGSLNWHEYIHVFVSPAVRNSVWAYQSKFKPVFEANRNKLYVANSYQTLDSYIGECIVRALDHRMQVAYAPAWAKDSLRRKFTETEKDEVINGLALIPYFASQLSAYESESAMDIASFVKKSLSSYSQ